VQDADCQWGYYHDYCQVFSECRDLETLADWGRELRGNSEVNEKTKRMLRVMYQKFKGRIEQ
jgi:hypothetical protein